jgi:hypothetical protein
MRKLLLITALFTSSLCQAQDTLFTIMTVKGIVVLDGDTIHCGQAVTSANQQLQIKGKRNYVTILTTKGYAFQVGRGKHRTKEIANSRYSKLAQRIIVHGAVVHSVPIPIILAGVNKQENPFLFGDSLTVIARSTTKPTKEYTISIDNLFGENVYDSTSTSHVITMGLSNLFSKNNALLFRITADRTVISSKDYYIKRINPAAALEFRYDLDCISTQDFVERELFIIALCEIHELYFDQLHQLYKLWKYSQNTGTKITSAYYQRLFKEYDLEKFLPVPLTGY